MSIESKETKPQRLLVIQDASRDVSPGPIRWLLQNFSFKPGDMLILFGFLHQVNNPMGYKVKVDFSSSIFGVNPKYVEEQVTRKTEEYSTNPEIITISRHCQMEQIKFHVEIRAGASPKAVVLKAAKTFKATWVVLDRQMKKDKKYFMEKLQCGVSRTKRDSSVEILREPEIRSKTGLPPVKKSQTKSLGYDEMIPGSPTRRSPSQDQLTAARNSSCKEVYVDQSKEVASQSFSTPFSKTSSSNPTMTTSVSTSNLSYQEEDYTNTERETGGDQSPFSNTEGNTNQGSQKEANIDSPNEVKQEKNYDDWMGGGPTDELFKNSVCSICKNRRPRIGWTRDFSYTELHAATKGFFPENFLSEGGFGSVYRGELGGLKIAVKQHKSASFQGEKEFKSEVNVLSKARNENLVMLLGSCSEGSHRLLVYEYVCNGSLDQHLSKHSRRPLSWEKRIKIALGAAKGLQYLHDNSIIHRDMRPNNILITHDHEALLGDFGLARTQNDDSDHSWETRVVGTLGYLAPEYAECGKVSTKTDVYAFGVVLLQLITGLKTTDKVLGGKSLVGWARPLLKEKNYPDLIDQRIVDSHDVHQLFWMVRVAEKCLSKYPRKRLSMDEVVYALTHLMDDKVSCRIKSYSPVQSYSVGSTPDSCGSPVEDTSFSIETTSQMNSRFPPSPPVGFPPSPFPISSSSHFYKNRQ